MLYCKSIKNLVGSTAATAATAPVTMLIATILLDKDATTIMTSKGGNMKSNRMAQPIDRERKREGQKSEWS